MVRVARRPKVSKRRHVQAKQRRAAQGETQKLIDQGIIRLVIQVIQQALREEVTRLLGRAKGQRRDLSDRMVVEARCNRCGSQYRADFYRAGFYLRGLLSLAAWGQIGVPRVSCRCGGMVDFEFDHLVPYGRLWFDMEERARELAAMCVSLRDGVRVLSWASGQPVSIATLNGLVNRTSDLAAAFHQGMLERIPAVVMLDGVWLKVLEPTGEEFLDKQGRKRDRLKTRKFPLLVAYGADPTSGERWVLDWQKGREEDLESWRTLLMRLQERGISETRGLRLFIHDGSLGLERALELVYFGDGVERQRCIFHKLQNVKRDVLGDEGMSPKERSQRRKEVLSDAAEVYKGKDEQETRQRLERFRVKWQDKEPRAVETLERGFEKTLVYLKVAEKARRREEEWRVECLRTTSPLERVQRAFRQKARQAAIFHSHKGVDAAIQLVIAHRHLADNSTQFWGHLLEEALLAA
ncbi:MAG TPA: transposase [Chloroflexota bacterium]|nr:transposase [Chloroflexota bacterium]